MWKPAFHTTPGPNTKARNTKTTAGRGASATTAADATASPDRRRMDGHVFAVGVACRGEAASPAGEPGPLLPDVQHRRDGIEPHRIVERDDHVPSARMPRCSSRFHGDRIVDGAIPCLRMILP